ncbi:hypothetical protein Misp04_20100 [Micromonospora sp. NBRC 101691]|nr:hypothetical protein Misp04_20100 [Micromonospora sp. NBRC 101691]
MPPSIAARAAANMAGGPSPSGNPWPRLAAPVRWASRVISVKIVGPEKARSRVASGVAVMSTPDVAGRYPTVLAAEYFRWYSDTIY